MENAIFIKERKGRFLCEVKIGQRQELCYVSNSSNMSKLLDLKNRPVLLKPNKGYNLRTNYTLYATYYEGSYFLLDLNDLNNVFAQYMTEQLSKNIQVRKEFKINDYKSDYYIPSQNRIVEIKGILSASSQAQYTFKNHKRAFLQLKEIKNLLQRGYNVNYVFIMLNPNIDTFHLKDKRLKENRLFLECIKLGMQVNFYKTELKQDKFKIYKNHVQTNF